MKVNNYFILFLVFFICTNFYSQEDNSNDLKKTQKKLFDFIIGMGITNNFCPVNNSPDELDGNIAKIVTYNNNVIFSNSTGNANINTSSKNYSIDYKLGLSIPMSFYFYFNNYVALGFTLKPGIIPISVRSLNLLSASGYQNYYMESNNSIRAGIKFGALNFKCLIEPGLTIDSLFNIINLNRYSNTFDNFLLLGPEIFIGFDFRTKKDVSLIWGGFFNVLFGSTNVYYKALIGYETVPDSIVGYILGQPVYSMKQQAVYKDITEYVNIVMLNFGIEFRFGYIFTKYKKI